MKTRIEYKVLETHRGRIFDIEIWDNGIVFFKADENTEVNLEDCQHNYDFLKSKFDGKNKHLILTVTSKFTTITKDAREYSTMPEKNQYTKACAVVVRSLAGKIVLNFIMYFIKKQGMSMKMFDEKEEAVEWLLGFKDDE